MLCVVDYAEVKQAFFGPRPGVVVELPDRATPGRRLRDAIEAIAMVSFWSEPAYDAYAALGLDFLGGYVLSRSAPLGRPAPAVVAATFGVFAPEAVAALYSQAAAVAAPGAVDEARANGARAALAEVLATAGGVSGAVTALRRACDAGSPSGRPLYAGLAAMEWPDDPLTGLWHACTTLREYRGDGHLAACVAHGVDGLEANILTELRIGWAPLEYTATRAWTPEAMADALDRLERRGLVAGGALTPAGSELRERIETATEAAVAPAVAALGADLDAVVADAEAWSQAIIDRGWFPPDPYKRAAG